MSENRQVVADVRRLEAVAGSPSRTVVQRFEHAPTQDHDRFHVHDRMELLYFTSSSGYVIDDVHHVSEGDVVVVPAGVRHRVTSGLVTGWYATFDADGLGDAGSVMSGRWWMHPLLRELSVGEVVASPVLSVAEEDRARWDARFKAMADELDEQPKGWTAAVRGHLLTLGVDLDRLALAGGAPSVADGHDLVSSVFEAIDATFGGDCSLAYVAGAVGYDRTYVAAVIKSQTGRSVGEWITERRMAEARTLLAGRDDIARVAKAVGFSDAGYFTRRFRQMHGVTPSEWRRWQHA